VLERLAREKEHAEDVGAEGALDLLGGNLGEILGLVLLGRVVDEDIEPAELLRRLRHDLAAEVGIADVAGKPDALTALALDRLDRLFRIGVFVKIGDGDFRAIATATARPMPLSPPVMSAT
jgi:hypothetical protein